MYKIEKERERERERENEEKNIWFEVKVADVVDCGVQTTVNGQALGQRWIHKPKKKKSSNKENHHNKVEPEKNSTKGQQSNAKKTRLIHPIRQISQHLNLYWLEAKPNKKQCTFNCVLACPSAYTYVRNLVIFKLGKQKVDEDNFSIILSNAWPPPTNGHEFSCVLGGSDQHKITALNGSCGNCGICWQDSR